KGMRVASVFDVAKYILKQVQRTSAMKLQKLMYYSQAWSLVWDEAPLFPEKICAWANGPVVPELYAKHRGEFQVSWVSPQGWRRHRSGPHAARNRGRRAGLLRQSESTVAVRPDPSRRSLAERPHRSPGRRARKRRDHSRGDGGVLRLDRTSGCLTFLISGA